MMLVRQIFLNLINTLLALTTLLWMSCAPPPSKFVNVLYPLPIHFHRIIYSCSLHFSTLTFIQTFPASWVSLSVFV